MHICRGKTAPPTCQGRSTSRSRSSCSHRAVDRFLLEYDDERSGGFEPLRFVRPGATVVLGLVSSKTPVLESQDDLRRRNRRGGQVRTAGELAISPQCGFASTSAGNVLTPDEQKAKLPWSPTPPRKVLELGGSAAADGCPRRRSATGLEAELRPSRTWLAGGAISLTGAS